MTLDLWLDVYKRNVELDDIFNEKYSNDELIYEKNCIEFLEELGEFINETKCFKYWSIKKPNQEDLLEELADCYTMLLYFYNILSFPITTLKPKENKMILDVINDTYILGTKLYSRCDKKVLDEIFINLLTIMNILDIKENEIIDAINKKHKKIAERLNSDY